MNLKKLASSLLCLGMAGALTMTVQASYPEYGSVSGVEDVGTNPSVSRSNIDNYIYQDEQVNINMDGADAGLYKVLRSNQKNNFNDYTVRLFPVNNADPREMRNVIRRVCALEGGTAEVIFGTDGANHIQVNAPTYMIPYLEKAVAALDVPWLLEYFDGAADVYIKLKHREADIVNTIAQFYAGTELDGVRDSGFSTLDTTNNAIRRFGSEYRNAEFAKAVEMIDIPVNQVNLEVKVYELTQSNDAKLGLDYIAWKNGPGRTLFTFAEGGFEVYSRASGALPMFYDPFDPFAGNKNPFNLASFPQDMTTVLHSAGMESYRSVNYLLSSNFVDFLRVKHLAKNIRSTNLVVTSSHSASIGIDTEVLSIQSDGGSGNPGNAKYDIYDRFVDYTSADDTVGITLNVTPYVGTESMEIDVELDIDEVAGLSPSGTPIINNRTVLTSARLLDGQPMVLAGLSTKDNVKGTAKAPILGSLPLVGYLAGGETDAHRTSDMIITITPTFVLGSQSSGAPARINTVKNIIDGTAPQSAPTLEFGYDMWLIGG